MYAGLTYRLSIVFPPNYPYVAPIVKFETPCYHPNVGLGCGTVCLDILQVGYYDERMVFNLKRKNRINGLLYTACKRFCYHFRVYWEVSR